MKIESGESMSPRQIPSGYELPEPPPVKEISPLWKETRQGVEDRRKEQIKALGEGINAALKALANGQPYQGSVPLEGYKPSMVRTWPEEDQRYVLVQIESPTHRDIVQEHYKRSGYDVTLSAAGYIEIYIP